PLPFFHSAFGVAAPIYVVPIYGKSLARSTAAVCKRKSIGRFRPLRHGEVYSGDHAGGDRALLAAQPPGSRKKPRRALPPAAGRRHFHALLRPVHAQSRGRDAPHHHLFPESFASMAPLAPAADAGRAGEFRPPRV